MKIAITGSRGITNQSLVDNLLDFYKDVCDLIIHGGCENSPDILAENWAQKNKIKTEIIRPDYKKYPNRYAPIARNKEIVDKADILLAFWDYKSKGTKSTIEFAHKKGINVIISSELDNNKNN